MKYTGLIITLAMFSGTARAETRCIEEVAHFSGANTKNAILVSNFGVPLLDNPCGKKAPAPTPVVEKKPEVKATPAVQHTTYNHDSTEGRLFGFLNDPTQKVDAIKGSWFDFDQVRFATGSAKLSAASDEQLKNVAEVMKKFPSATFKIGGYTDNVGKEASNKKLSQARAESVFARLKELGVSASQLTGAEGYGSSNAIASNETEEGRAKNRRMSVRVKSK